MKSSIHITCLIMGTALCLAFAPYAASAVSVDGTAVEYEAAPSGQGEFRQWAEALAGKRAAFQKTARTRLAAFGLQERNLEYALAVLDELYIFPDVQEKLCDWLSHKNIHVQTRIRVLNYHAKVLACIVDGFFSSGSAGTSRTPTISRRVWAWEEQDFSNAESDAKSIAVARFFAHRLLVMLQDETPAEYYIEMQKAGFNPAYKIPRDPFDHQDGQLIEIAVRGSLASRNLASVLSGGREIYSAADIGTEARRSRRQIESESMGTTVKRAAWNLHAIWDFPELREQARFILEEEGGGPFIRLKMILTLSPPKTEG